MKFTKLLVLGVLALCGANSAWAVDGNVWTKPTLPAVTEFVSYQEVTATDDGAEIYLYNVGAHLFFTDGNNWGTRASLLFNQSGNGDGATSTMEAVGNKVWFLRSDNTKSEGVVELKSYVRSQSTIKSTFADNAASIWTDNNGGANHFWQVVPAEDGYYIKNADIEPTLVLGWKGSYSDTRLYLIDPAAEGVGAVWKMVAPAVYEAWAAQDDVKNFIGKNDIYNAAMALKETLDKAEAIEAKVADQIAVYNNTASTKDELTAANTAAQEAILEREKEIAAGDLNSATGQNPKSASAFIANPNFDEGSNAGWKGTAPNMSGDGNHKAANVAEVYNNTFDTYQDIAGLPAGVYSLSVQAGHRGSYTDYTTGSNADALPYLYVVAGDSTKANFSNLWSAMNTESYVTKVGDKTYFGTPNAEGNQKVGDVTYYIPNNPSTFRLYAEDGYYKSLLFFELNGTQARIGVKKNVKATDTDWAMFDSFDLQYYGAGADAYQAWSDAMLKQYAITAPQDGSLFTQSYYDALAAATVGKTAASKAEAEANIAAAEAALAVVKENASLWNQWAAKVDEGYKMVNDNMSAVTSGTVDVTIAQALLMYVASDASMGIIGKAVEIKEKKALTNEELVAEIATVQQLIKNFDNALKNQIKAGDDVTKYLKNPAFDDGAGAESGWTGWHKTTNSMPTTGGTTDNKTAEAWSAKEFDLYQVVEDAPVGVYEISVQGFYRYGRDDNAYNIYKSQEIEYVKPGSAPVYVYMNDKKTPFKNIYDEESPGQDFYVSMANTAEDGTPLAGANGIYQWKAIPYSVQNYPADAPTMFFPNGMASAAVAFSAGMYTQKATSLVAKQGDVLRLGVKGSTQQPGQSDCWVIWDNFKLTYKGKSAEDVKPVLQEAIQDAKNMLKDPETQEEKPIGKDAYEQLMAAIASAEAALASNDGAKMFDELAALVSVNVDASAAKFAALKSAYLKFEDAVNTAEAADASEKPADATIAAAWALHDEVMEGMENRTMTDADADAKMKEMEEMTVKLLIPATFDIASDAQPANATFYVTNPKYADNADTGWTGGAAVANHEAEMFNKDFDYYQDIENVKPGTYRLSIQGFYRAGSSLNDYKLFTEMPDSANNAFLYAVTANGTSSAPLKRLASCAIQQTAGEAIPADWAAAKTDTIFNANGEKVDTILTHTVVVNRMSTAEQVFAKEDAAENYSGTSVVVKVGDDGKLRIGVKKQARIESEWTIWTNWQLTYYGANSTLVADGDASGINETRGAAVVKAEYFTIGGAQVSKPGKGVAIVKQTLSDGTVKIQKVIIK